MTQLVEIVTKSPSINGRSHQIKRETRFENTFIIVDGVYLLVQLLACPFKTALWSNEFQMWPSSLSLFSVHGQRMLNYHDGNIWNSYDRYTVLKGQAWSWTNKRTLSTMIESCQCIASGLHPISSYWNDCCLIFSWEHIPWSVLLQKRILLESRPSISTSANLLQFELTTNCTDALHFAIP